MGIWINGVRTEVSTPADVQAFLERLKQSKRAA